MAATTLSSAAYRVMLAGEVQEGDEARGCGE